MTTMHWKMFLLIVLIGLFTNYSEIYSQEEQKFSTYFYDKCSAFDILPVKEGRIIFIGDSITDRCEWSELFQRTDIIRRGISGDISEGVLKRLPEIIRRKPSKIFLMIGVNDLRRNLDIDHEVVINYAEIIQQIKKELPKTKIYVQSVLPVNNIVKDTKTTNLKVKELNFKLKNLSLKEGVEFIDLFSQFIDENGNLKNELTSDGLHINGTGYEIWSNLIAEDIKE